VKRSEKKTRKSKPSCTWAAGNYIRRQKRGEKEPKQKKDERQHRSTKALGKSTHGQAKFGGNGRPGRETEKKRPFGQYPGDWGSAGARDGGGDRDSAKKRGTKRVRIQKNKKTIEPMKKNGNTAVTKPEGGGVKKQEKKVGGRA